MLSLRVQAELADDETAEGFAQGNVGHQLRVVYVSTTCRLRVVYVSFTCLTAKKRLFYAKSNLSAKVRTILT